MGTARSVGLLWTAVFAAFLVAGCGASENSGRGGGQDGRDASVRGSGPAGSRVSVEIGGAEALAWGEGGRGAVLAHGAAYDEASWEDQGRRISGSGAVALAVEDTSARSAAGAARYLKKERGVRDVTLVGASAGAAGVLGAAEANPGLADGLILLSGTGDVSGLGGYPKLFAASEGEGLAETVRNMAEEAPGDRNEVLILPGDAHAQAVFETDQKARLMWAILELVGESGQCPQDTPAGPLPGAPSS